MNLMRNGIKLKKPDVRIYKHVLFKLSKKPEEVIFIDDNVENIESAKSIGMGVILFKNLDQLKNEIKTLLGQINGLEGI